uniref:Ferredoxin MycCII n=1 Tax=Micromonospora griseorubida TaxID=28040 RepID=MYCII_MICGR|nr:RecName: Full=Ferredoxin MycCII; AltName: Full=Mycinamicin biosynthesis protein CII [Micromonospora griseorubida]BAC57024.1 ferredxin [Micromonospora griseorubida]
MRIVLDAERCVGAGQCEATAPELFTQGDDGLGLVRDRPVTPELLGPAREAVDRCPVRAIRIESSVRTGWARGAG